MKKGEAMNSRFKLGSTTMQLIVLGIALCAAVMAHAGGSEIYRSYDASGRPTYSDRPINKASQLFAMYDGHQLWPRAGTGPVSLPQLTARRNALEPLVQRVAKMHGVHAALLKAVI